MLDQLTFEEILKENDYFSRLHELKSMQPGQEKEFITPNCKVLIKYIGNTVWSKGSYYYKLSDETYGYSFNVNSLAGNLIVGFYESIECKWINGEPVPWVPNY